MWPHVLTYRAIFVNLSYGWSILQFEHSAVHEEMMKEHGRAGKLENKINITTHGYVTREKKLKETIQVAWSTLQVCFHL